MKAVRIHEYGGSDKLRYEETPSPQLLSPDDVIVELRAAALNDSDICIRRGLSRTGVSFPHILGSDGAGVVVDVGKTVKNVKRGQAVCLYPASGCGRCEYCMTDREFMCIQLRLVGEREDGTYAEYVRILARNCFSIPSRLSFEEAAAVPLVYVTVWRMLVTNAVLKPGELLLILGIGGGVATAALQLAAHIGARIIVASSNEEKLARAKQLGAEHGINDGIVDWVKAVRHISGKRGVDVVLDCMGGEAWVKSLAALAKGGRLVTCGATASAQPETDIRRIFWNHLKIFGSTLGSREEFCQVLNFIETSGTKPVIDHIFSLSQAATAQRYLEEAKQFGKIVLRAGE